jgi:hypothetical protein
MDGSGEGAIRPNEIQVYLGISLIELEPEF